MNDWKFCPECGCSKVHHEEGTHKQCKRCHQKWWSDVDYSDAIAKKLVNEFDAEEIKRYLIGKAKTVGFLCIEDIEDAFKKLTKSQEVRKDMIEQFPPAREEESPVKQTVLKKIVPGEYGYSLVNVIADEGKTIRLSVNGGLFDSVELRAVAKVFTQLSEFLEEQRNAI